MKVQQLKQAYKGAFPVYLWMKLSADASQIGGAYVVVQKSSLADALKTLPDSVEFDVVQKEDGVYIGGPRKQNDKD